MPEPTRPPIEVGDIFRDHGLAWRRAHRGHISLGQFKVMSAIERCRTAALGGHVLQCEGCQKIQIAYNSCRNRHCPKCQSVAAKRWLEARQADLLPVGYYHVVFTIPSQLRDIALQNKAVVYDLLFKAVAETLLTIGNDPDRLGARLGFTAVLHTWGSALVHHPHIHCIVPGGGVSAETNQWVASRPNYLLPVQVLSARFKGVFLEKLTAAHRAGRLEFFGHIEQLADRQALSRYLHPLTQLKWVVDARRPFAGPKAVLAYLSRYTHRVAISNSRIKAYDERGVTFTYKDYRDKKTRFKRMTLAPDEFIRRFLIHVLPRRFHRIRHYGFLANHQRAKQIALIRECLVDDTVADVPKPSTANVDASADSTSPTYTCPSCGQPMIIIQTFERPQLARAPPIRQARLP